MLPEIGSNFWEYDLSHPRTHKFWWESNSYHSYFFKSGRNATKAIGISLQKCEEKKILLPAYLCETEVDPWKDLGWSICFYQVNRDFTICVSDLKKQIVKFQPTVVLVQSYFGFLQDSQGLKEILELFREANGIVIEDITQSLFTDKSICYADFYVASLRKFLAIPDGGVLISLKELKFASTAESNPDIDQMAKKAFSRKKEYFYTLDPSTKLDFRKLYQALNELIVVNENLSLISPLSKEIVAHMDFDEICSTRKQNYSILYQNLMNLDQINIVTPEIEYKDEQVPLYLPVYFKSSEIRNQIRGEMAKRDIYCPIIWPRLSSTEVDNVESLYIFDHILCLPIDQRYESEEMSRISETLFYLCKKINGSALS